MHPEYRKHYRELFQKHWWWRARTELVARELERLQPADGWKSILDVGCGEGLFFDRLSKFGDVEGVELEEALGPDSRWRDRIYVRGFDETFKPDKKYALILMLDVLEHLSEPRRALDTAHRLLAQNGTLLATVPAFRVLWTNHDVLNRHITRYTMKTFRKLVEEAGFSVTEQRYFFQWAFPAKLVVRAAESILPRPPQVPRVPPRWLNETLYFLSRAEQKSAGALHLPFGSSLLAIARKSAA